MPVTSGPECFCFVCLLCRRKSAKHMPGRSNSFEIGRNDGLTIVYKSLSLSLSLSLEGVGQGRATVGLVLLAIFGQGQKDGPIGAGPGRDGPSLLRKAEGKAARSDWAFSLVEG